jgi:hypothetical protein
VTLTVFGVSGGVGVTTLVAITRDAIRDGNGRPVTVSANAPQSLQARLAAAQTVPASGGLLHDGGRFSLEKARTAVDRGKIVLVTSRTPLGAQLAQDRLAELQQAGLFDGRVFGVVETALFGGRARNTLHPDLPHFRVIYDRVLAQPGAVTIENAGDNVARSMSQWLEAVRHSVNGRG